MEKRNILKEKTTWIGVMGFVAFWILVGALIMGKIDATGFAVAIGGVITFLGAALSKFARDPQKPSE